MDTNIEILLEEYVMAENLIERHEIETKKLKEQKMQEVTVLVSQYGTEHQAEQQLSDQEKLTKKYI